MCLIVGLKNKAEKIPNQVDVLTTELNMLMETCEAGCSSSLFPLTHSCVDSSRAPELLLQGVNLLSREMPESGGLRAAVKRLAYRLECFNNDITAERAKWGERERHCMLC